MGTTYQMADADAAAMLESVMDQYHQDLIVAKVRVGMVMCWNLEGNAVKVGGYPAVACVRVCPLVDRLTKGYDAEIRVDRWWWESAKLPDERRRAVLDHELCHLQLSRDDGGRLQFDDLNRPKLKLRPGDWNGGDGFACVIERHGDHAQESHNFDAVAARIKAAKEPKPTLFDDLGKPAESDADAVDPAEAEAPTAPADEPEWRSWHITVLGLSDALHQSITRMAGINCTLGQLSLALDGGESFGLGPDEIGVVRDWLAAAASAAAHEPATEAVPPKPRRRKAGVA